MGNLSHIQGPKDLLLPLREVTPRGVIHPEVGPLGVLVVIPGVPQGVGVTLPLMGQGDPQGPLSGVILGLKEPLAPQGLWDPLGLLGVTGEF